MEKDDHSPEKYGALVPPSMVLSLLLCIALLVQDALEHWSAGDISGGLLSLAGIAALLWTVFILRNSLFAPLRLLTEFLEKPDGENGSLPDGLEGPADVLGKQLHWKMAEALAEMERTNVETTERAEREARLRTAAELAAFSPPEVPEDYPAASCFSLRGKVWAGKGCQLYDVFFADPGLLCVLICESKDGSATEAMLLAHALGMLRSLLRRGRTLEESVTELHRFYVLQNRTIRLQALTLNLQNGVTELLSAGTKDPALLRFEENSIWYDIDNGEPLGAGQERLFHPNKLRMKNGDILLLYAEGNSDFAVRSLREILNRCQSEKGGATTERIVERIGQAMETQQEETFTAVALQYIKPDRMASACTVPAEPESCPEVLAYLKQCIREYGVPRRASAAIAVVTEELFMLCCRVSTTPQHVKVLCSIADDGGTVTIRIEGSFGGTDPLEREDVAPAGSLDFIKSQSYCQYIVKPDGIDVLMAVFFPEPDEESAPQGGEGT